MRKLLSILNAILKHGRPWRSPHHPASNSLDVIVRVEVPVYGVLVISEEVAGFS